MSPEGEKSSSSSSSSSSEEEEKVVGAVRRVPTRESSSEDEDEDGGDEEQEEEFKKPPTVNSQSAPLADSQHESMDTATKAVHGKNPASTRNKHPLDENQAVGSAKRKKGSNQITTEEKEASTVQKKSSQRVWSVEDEKNLISSFQEFIQKKLGSHKNITSFFKFWEERGGKFSKRQVEEKLRRFKEKYSIRQKMEQRGESKGFTRPPERDIYMISKEIWGVQEDEEMGKGEKKGENNQGSPNREGNKGKREENKGEVKESNSRKKKEEKVKSEKTEIRSPNSRVRVAGEECGSEKEKNEETDPNKKEPHRRQGSPKSKGVDEEAKLPKSDTIILDGKPNDGGEGEDNMEPWRILVTPTRKLVGIYEAVEKGVMLSTKLKTSELEVTRRKLEKMRSKIHLELMELRIERANLALEVMKAVHSAGGKV